MRHPIRILFAATSLTAAGLLGAGCAETVDKSPPKLGQTTPRPTPYSEASASAARANQYRQRPDWDRSDAFHSATVICAVLLVLGGVISWLTIPGSFEEAATDEPAAPTLDR